MGEFDELEEFNYLPDRSTKSAKSLRANIKNDKRLTIKSRKFPKWKQQLAAERRWNERKNKNNSK